MNVREEERQKNTCPSRGLGLAAAAIGVGVGAALYYFFSKRPENPDGEGSTTGWHSEEPHAFKLHEDSDSYTTISEHSTTDTSMEETDTEDDGTNSTSNEFSSDMSDSETSFNVSLSSPMTGLSSDIELAMGQSFDSESSFHITISSSTTFDRFSLNSTNDSSDSDIRMEWDVTNLSEGLPEDVRSPMIPIQSFLNRFRTPSPRQRNVAQERVTTLRDQAFRERSWSLEECSICFDVILKDQQVTTLPCTHHFHSDCITPWLQEQQTCPNCRKAAE